MIDKKVRYVPDGNLQTLNSFLSRPKKKKKKNSNGIDKASKTVDTSGTLQNMLSISTIQVELHLYSRAMAVINAVSSKKFLNCAHYNFTVTGVLKYYVCLPTGFRAATVS